MKYLIMVMALLLSACSVVGPGQRGVRISFGTLSPDVKPPGLYLWVPGFLGMAKVDVQIQKSMIETTAGSKDSQDVHTVIAINWNVTPDKVVRTYEQVGNEYYVEQNILLPAVNEVMKAAVAKRTAEETLTKRLEMKKDIDTGLLERLAAYGVTLHDVSVVDLKFSAGYARAIEQKQIAEQEAKQAAYVADKATQDVRAEIERAKGQAESQKLVRSSITPEILQQKAIEKWDGHFPQVMGGTGTLPFINLKVGGQQ